MCVEIFRVFGFYVQSCSSLCGCVEVVMDNFEMRIFDNLFVNSE